jgi:hypothetical protein
MVLAADLPVDGQSIPVSSTYPQRNPWKNYNLITSDLDMSDIDLYVHYHVWRNITHVDNVCPDANVCSSG